jgi:gliding motility-associated lipoprotein GldH
VKNNYLVILLFGLGVVCFSACQINQTFEKNVLVPDDKWDYNFKPTYQFTVSDTNSRYNLFINVRHLDEYAFMNMWVWVHLQQPDGKLTHQRIQIPLAEPDGKWLGDGLNGVWFAQLPYKNFYRFHAKGEYTLTIEQDMRINPLPAILAIGLKVVRLENSSIKK